MLNAALETFSRDGFEGATVKAIAQRANVGHGTVFWHFRDKAQLYAQAIELAGDRLLGLLRCDLENNDATLSEVVVAWVGVLRRADYSSSLLSIGRRTRGDAAIASAVRSFDRRLVEYWEGRLSDVSKFPLSSVARRHELAQVIVALGRVFAAAEAAAPLLVEFAAALEMTFSQGRRTGSADPGRRRAPVDSGTEGRLSRRTIGSTTNAPQPRCPLRK